MNFSIAFNVALCNPRMWEAPCSDDDKTAREVCNPRMWEAPHMNMKGVGNDYV